MDAFPGHGFRPFQHGVDIDQLRAVPMLFQNSPAAFDGIVLAVIRGVVKQLNGLADGVGKGHEAVKELGAPPMAFWAIVGLDLEGGDLLALGQRQTVPSGFEAVDDEIAGFRRGAKTQAHLSAVLLQDAKGCIFFMAAHVMIGRTSLPTGELATRRGADVDGGLTVDAHALERALRFGLSVFFVEIGKERVRFGGFFWGLALITGRNR